MFFLRTIVNEVILSVNDKQIFFMVYYILQYFFYTREEEKLEQLYINELIPFIEVLFHTMESECVGAFICTLHSVLFPHCSR